jgi:hypothetical protein
MQTSSQLLFRAAALLPGLALTACAANAVKDGAQAPVPPLPPVPHAARAAATLPAPSDKELQLGIQVTHIGLTASGGLVDLRMKVLDPARASALLHDPANAPVLLAGDLPPLAAPHKALHGARYSQGQVIYVLYPNTRGAVQPGMEVVVALGEARLGPVTAQ